MNRFKQALDRAIKQAEAKVGQIAAQALERLYQEHIVARSPIWEGPYVSNFTFTTGSPAVTESPRAEEGAKGANAAGVREAAMARYVQQIKDASPQVGGTYYITNNVPYAAEIEAYGSPKGRGLALMASTAVVWNGMVDKEAKRVR